MSLKTEMKDYQARWREVEKIQSEERRSASPGLRWQQLNSVYQMAKGLGWLKSDPSEREIFERWAKLKEAQENQKPKD
jgi:hypothetical protein